VPCLRSCIARFTFFDAFLPYRLAMTHSSRGLVRQRNADRSSGVPYASNASSSPRAKSFPEFTHT
jgi:hypothetical protein